MEPDVTAVVAALLQSAERVRRTSERLADSLRQLVETISSTGLTPPQHLAKWLDEWTEAAESYDSLMGDLWIGSSRPVIRQAWNPDNADRQAEQFRKEG